MVWWSVGGCRWVVIPGWLIMRCRVWCWCRVRRGGSGGERADAGVEWGVWPPGGAHAVDVDGFYDRLTERGYEYGPVFQGLTAGWARGPELFAEVALPEQADPNGFAIHPALFDAAL